MRTPYNRRRRRPEPSLLHEAGQLVNGLMWMVAAALVTVLFIYAGLLFGADVDAIHLVRDYQQHMAGVRATATADALGGPAPTAAVRTYPTPAPLGNVPAAQPATGEGLSVSEVNATVVVEVAPDLNTAPATFYVAQPDGGGRSGGAWGDTPAEPAPHALAPEPQPTAIPANYNPPATSGGRSAGSWGAP